MAEIVALRKSELVPSTNPLHGERLVDPLNLVRATPYLQWEHRTKKIGRPPLSLVGFMRCLCSGVIRVKRDVAYSTVDIEKRPFEFFSSHTCLPVHLYGPNPHRRASRHQGVLLVGPLLKFLGIE